METRDNNGKAVTILRIAMIGMIPGNGHPYSWSTIINGYDERYLSNCPYPLIWKFMKAQADGKSGIEGMQVTHIWTDRSEDAALVAAAAKIESILDRPEDAIGNVDAVFIATDDGDHHVARVRPFIEAGLPVFIDKPLATNVPDLKTFHNWANAGKLFMSCSGLRYSDKLTALKSKVFPNSKLSWMSAVIVKDWESYGIHAIECASQIVGPGFERISVKKGTLINVVNIEHRSGTVITVPILEDAPSSFGAIQLCTSDGVYTEIVDDYYSSFKNTIMAFVKYVKSGHNEIKFAETTELMAVIIAGRFSESKNGKWIKVKEVLGSIF